ncbi:uncharacterized protein LOC132264899 isoform X2 [Phlebotomus argentipes]|nr:uncharacterized protein LOC132264899 isoform X2 [Phlebotomus argentipes]
MYKAIVSYTTKGKDIDSRSLVVKTLPTDDSVKKEILKDMPIFDREIDMYTKVLPEMKKIMDSIGDNEQMSPRILYYSRELPIIIFEDITKQGYEMNQEFWDFDNTIKILKKLAKFHALSFYMNDNKYAHKMDFENYKPILITEKSIDQMQTFVNGLSSLVEEIDTWPGFEDIARKLEGVIPTLLKAVLDIYKPNPEPGFNVLCHGDFNLKNLMYKKNGKDIDNMLFIDFQMSFWTSPAVDLLYVMNVIGNQEVRRRRGEAVMIYHEVFTDYLSRLGCLRKGPSLRDLNIDMLKYGKVEVHIGVGFMPIFYLDFANNDVVAAADLTNYNQKNFYDVIYKNPKITDIMKEILQTLYYKGLLD